MHWWLWMGIATLFLPHSLDCVAQLVEQVAFNL